MEVKRPDPDELLVHVQAEERQRARGRLTIFLGYAAGVGKTYAMLEAARQRKGEGAGVVIGYVETHGRAETEALVKGLELVPRKLVDYRGTRLPEMDLDAVLARRPQIALVDELAHTNAPGSRHPKRYHDVLELLDAGIDVYTTLNIQHLESLNDVVAQITGVVVRETLPDRVLDDAADLRVVDLPPDDLIQRLSEGKVYVPDQAARAVERFFRKGNLTALRELALRRAARRVDEQMVAYMQTRAIPGPWPAGERLLVCVGASPLGERLVRTTRRLAEQLGAEWFAVYVETPEHARLTDDGQGRVAATLKLAEELGAQTRMLPGTSVTGAVVDFAQQHNVTKIVAGKPWRARWLEWLRPSVVDDLIRRSGGIDVYVISGAPGEAQPAERRPWWQTHSTWEQYLWSAALVAVATLLGWPLQGLIAPANLVMLYLAVVMVAAAYLGRGPSILASLLSVLAFDFFFVEPRLTLAVSDTEYLLTFLGLLVVGLVISDLAARAREQAQSALQREAQTAALYALSRDLAAAADLDEILRAVVRHIGETFRRAAVVLLPETSGRRQLVQRAQSPGFILGEQERAVATWAFQHGQPAGRGTDTLPAAYVRYLPLKTAGGVVGVVGVRPSDPNRYMSPAQRQLLEAFAHQAALAIERALLSESARHAQILQTTERLQTALLNSISHDLRTPLVSIIGALSSLQEDEDSLEPAIRRALIANAREEVERLNRLVGNLLDMSRLAAGALQLHCEPDDVQDLAGSALAQLGERLHGRPVQVEVPDDLPLVLVDDALMVQVLVNLLDNAHKYSPTGAPIEISACRADRRVEIAVADRGVGIPPEDLTRVFDKFYRVQRPSGAHSPNGTGLGLSICQGIVEAHGGRIWAENRPGGGSVFRFTLPVEARESLYAGGGADE